MNDSIKKERSPSSPRVPLSDGIELVKRLYLKAGKSAIHPENAVQAIGYAGLNGTALGILAALKQYGLLDSERGSSVAVSSLAVKLIHPLNPAQEAESLRAAALSPRIFNDLHSEGYSACSEDVLANHLIQSGFTPDGAKKAASVFKQNQEFAKLGDSSIEEPVNSALATLPISTPKDRPLSVALPTQLYRVDEEKSASRPYRFLLDGDCEVELQFFGSPVGPDQVQGLIDYLDVMKKRLTREGGIAPEKPIVSQGFLDDQTNPVAPTKPGDAEP